MLAILDELRIVVPSVKTQAQGIGAGEGDDKHSYRAVGRFATRILRGESVLISSMVRSGRLSRPPGQAVLIGATLHATAPF